MKEDVEVRKAFEEIFGKTLDFILKSWDPEKESYSEWYERIFAHDKHYH